ncbi:hypothetical protein KAW11_00390 [Candidatus Bathyarchaeota archaeon]|nr:hypothetical protein [Candidatus Bathyarchaeota archaeon]
MTEEKMPMYSNVFDLLAKPVRNALTQLGFSEPTAPQVKAIPAILREEKRFKQR